MYTMFLVALPLVLTLCCLAICGFRPTGADILGLVLVGLAFGFLAELLFEEYYYFQLADKMSPETVDRGGILWSAISCLIIVGTVKNILNSLQQQDKGHHGT